MGENIGISMSQIREDEERLMMFDDIEEDLGCPLDILIKALKSGVFVNSDIYGEETKSGLKYFIHIHLFSSDDFRIGLLHNSMWKGDEIIATRKLSDYKKTWWLKEDKSE